MKVILQFIESKTLVIVAIKVSWICAISINMLGVLLSCFLIANIAEPSLGCFPPFFPGTATGRSNAVVDSATPEGMFERGF